MGQIPQYDISIDDVKKELGESTNDLGLLCTSDKINKWSLYKPVSGDWPGETLGFDITNVTAQNPSGLYNTQWTYEKPKGGENSPYRLGDFRGYDHDVKYDGVLYTFGVVNPVKPTAGSNLILDFNTGLSQKEWSSPYYMPAFKNMYMAASIYKGTSTSSLYQIYNICMGGDLQSSLGERVVIDKSIMNFRRGDNVRVIPFITPYKFSDGTSTNNYQKYNLNATGKNSHILDFTIDTGGSTGTQFRITATSVLDLGSGLRVFAEAVAIDSNTTGTLKVAYRLSVDNYGLGEIIFSNLDVNKLYWQQIDTVNMNPDGSPTPFQFELRYSQPYPTAKSIVIHFYSSTYNFETTAVQNITK